MKTSRSRSGLVLVLLLSACSGSESGPSPGSEPGPIRPSATPTAQPSTQPSADPSPVPSDACNDLVTDDEALAWETSWPQSYSSAALALPASRMTCGAVQGYRGFQTFLALTLHDVPVAGNGYQQIALKHAPLDSAHRTEIAGHLGATAKVKSLPTLLARGHVSPTLAMIGEKPYLISAQVTADFEGANYTTLRLSPASDLLGDGFSQLGDSVKAFESGTAALTLHQLTPNAADRSVIEWTVRAGSSPLAEVRRVDGFAALKRRWAGAEAGAQPITDRYVRAAVLGDAADFLRAKSVPGAEAKILLDHLAKAAFDAWTPVPSGGKHDVSGESLAQLELIELLEPAHASTKILQLFRRILPAFSKSGGGADQFDRAQALHEALDLHASQRFTDAELEAVLEISRLGGKSLDWKEAQRLAERASFDVSRVRELLDFAAWSAGPGGATAHSESKARELAESLVFEKGATSLQLSLYRGFYAWSYGSQGASLFSETRCRDLAEEVIFTQAASAEQVLRFQDTYKWLYGSEGVGLFGTAGSIEHAKRFVFTRKMTAAQFEALKSTYKALYAQTFSVSKSLEEAEKTVFGL
jgi:hypothetical protein